MQHSQGYRLSFSRAEDCHILALYRNIRPPKMLQSSYQRNASGVDQIAIVVKHMYIGAQVETLGARDDAERLGVEGRTSSDSFFKDTGEDHFVLRLSAYSVRLLWY